MPNSEPDAEECDPPPKVLYGGQAQRKLNRNTFAGFIKNFFLAKTVYINKI